MEKVLYGTYDGGTQDGLVGGGPARYAGQGVELWGGDWNQEKGKKQK